MVDVKFMLVNDDKVQGILPKKSEELSTGYDVFNAGEDIAFQPFEHKLIPLGFKVFLPEGWWMFLVPRSSTHAKKHLHTLYGVIDESYEGMVYFSAQYIPKGFEHILNVNWTGSCRKADTKDTNLFIKHGDPIAQVMIMPRYEMNVENVSEEEFKKLCENRGAKRGEKGFGGVGG